MVLQIKNFSSNMSNTRDCVSTRYPDTWKRVENTTSSGVFLTNFEVFGLPMKHCLDCLIYLLNRNKNCQKLSRSMLIKTGYPNLLHGCDFLCFNLMNNIINEFENVTGKVDYFELKIIDN